jgi:hypothetical protein
VGVLLVATIAISVAVALVVFILIVASTSGREDSRED